MIRSIHAFVVILAVTSSTSFATEQRLSGNAKLSPQARSWLQAEAKREQNSGNLSATTATKAIQAADPALNLNAIPMEDAVGLVMSAAEKDAKNDLRQSLNEMNETNADKKALRDAAIRQKSNQRVQPGMDRLQKAEAKASNVLKKTSDTQSSLAGNIK